MAEIVVRHQSMLAARRMPRGFGAMPVTNEQRELLERLALDIFADMTNAGQTFQAALAAVYFSGMQHAIETDVCTGKSGGDVE